MFNVNDESEYKEYCKVRDLEDDVFVRWIEGKCDVTESGCLIFTGKRYPTVFRKSTQVTVSRYILGCATGRVLESWEFACHRCNNPKCVSKDHLFIGSHQDNIGDMISRRASIHKILPGESGHVCDLVQCKRFTRKEVAEMYGVCVVTIDKHCRMARKSRVN